MSVSINIGARALSVNMAALGVVGHNIANASTDGYSRQSANLSSAGYQAMAGNYFGRGVDIGSVTRSHNVYLHREAQAAASMAAAESERLELMQQLETAFPTGESGLGASVNQMLNAWGDVASSPTNQAARMVALSRGEALAARLSDSATQMDIMANTGRQKAQTTVESVNRLAQDIAQINLRIVEIQGSSSEPNDLLDQRDALMDELSRYVQITTMPASDGSLGVFLAGSQPLVLGQHANALALQRNPVDPTQSSIAFVQSGFSFDMPPSSIGGQLGGLMTFLREDLPAMQNQLGRMALALNSSLNTQHSLGVDLAGNAGGDFFVPAANAAAMPATTNTGTAQIHTAVSDPTAFMASDYRITATAAGFDIVRMVDGTSSSFAGLPATMDGLDFELTAGATSVGDSFLVRPFAAAARDMQMALSAPHQLAVASPVFVSPGTTNGGGVAIESLYAHQPSANLTDPVTLTFLANGSFTATGLGPGNPAPDNAGPPASYNYTPGQQILFNGWSLTLRGEPTAGDSFTISATPVGSAAQNGGNAKAVLALRDRPTFEGVSLADGYGSLLSHLGTEVQGAKFANEFSSQIAASSENARASVSGVNLDEEAARLLQFQQAYQAAAKFLQVAQSAFDTMLQAMR